MHMSYNSRITMHLTMTLVLNLVARQTLNMCGF